MKRTFLPLLTFLLLLVGCSQPPVETTVPPAQTTVTHLTTVVTPDTIGFLEEYPDLRSVDLSGSTCYEDIFRYMEAHPKVAVTYTVQLGTVTVSKDDTSLILDPGACDYATLVENLGYLPRLTQVSMPRTAYTPQELTALIGLFPQITWDYSLLFLGQELTGQTESMNLSLLEPDRFAEALEILPLLPNLVSAELMNPSGQCVFSREEVLLLMEAAPQVRFHYVFDLFGKTVSTDDTRIEFIDQAIGNEGEGAIREALDVLPQCRYLLLDNCGLDNEVLSGIRADYRATTEVVWRVWFGEDEGRDCLTDTDTIRAVSGLTDKNTAALQYCEKVKYLDVGYNKELHTVSFLASMPELEICILSGCPVEDLEPLSGATKLIFLELAHCNAVADLSPLSGCTALENLNLSYTAATDLSPLWELPLKQLCAVVTQIPWNAQTTVMEKIPECSFRFEGTQAFGTGWYYKKSGAKTDIYAKVLEVFGLER